MEYKFLCKKECECSLCHWSTRLKNCQYPKLTNCNHRSCLSCLRKYVQITGMKGKIVCPICSQPLVELDIYYIIQNFGYLIDEYERSFLKKRSTKALKPLNYTYDSLANFNCEYSHSKLRTIVAIREIIRKRPLFETSFNHNMKFKTLHYYTAKKDMNSIIKMITQGCDINAQTSKGNTPLHIAVACSLLEITRTLLVLGADPNIINERGETPRHIAAKLCTLKPEPFSKLESHDLLKTLIIGGAKRCSSFKRDCQIDCKNHFLQKDWDSASLLFSELKTLENKTLDISYSKISIQEQYQKEIIDGNKEAVIEKNRIGDKNLINILSLDGGGICGLVILQILIEIEKEMGEPVFPYFDWVAGTSTGGIIAAALTKGKSLRDCQKLYLRFKDIVFSGIRPFETAVIEKFLQDEMGHTVRLSDIPWPRLTIPALKVDERPAQTIFMRNYNCLAKEDDILLWKALRRTSAAPIYFETAECKYVDGGLSSNNPMNDLLTEITNENLKVSIGCALSIGTGKKTSVPSPQIMRFSINPIKGIPTVKSFFKLGTVLIDQATATEGRPTDHAQARCKELDIPYFRLNPPLSKDIALDSKDNSELVKMMWECMEYVYMNTEKIIQIVLLLKENGPSFTRKHLFRNTPEQKVTKLPISEYFIPANSNDPDIKLLALRKIHESFMNLTQPSEIKAQSQEILNSEIYSVLVRSLKSSNTSIQYEAFYIVNSAIERTENKHVFLPDLIPVFFELLNSGEENVRGEAIRALEICMWNIQHRDLCINLGIIPILTAMILNETAVSFLCKSASVFVIT